MVRQMARMGVEPILPIRQAIIISPMINFDGDGDWHGDGVGTCKHALRLAMYYVDL